MTLIDLIKLVAHAQDLFRVDGDVSRLPEVTARGLVDHDRGVGKTVAFAGLAAAEEERAHRGGLADTDCANWRGDVGHCVVDCEA